jgi:hypothetical protein
MDHLLICKEIYTREAAMQLPSPDPLRKNIPRGKARPDDLPVADHQRRTPDLQRSGRETGV